MNTQKGHILIIDDDQTLSGLLAKFLAGEGFRVSTLEGGPKALEVLLQQKQCFDGIVLDIMMPEMSGLEELQQLRDNDNSDGNTAIDTPIIMLTGRGDDIDRILGLEMGADDYLAKPCNPRELSARLKAVLRRTQAKPEHDQASNDKTEKMLYGIHLNSSNLETKVGASTLQLTSAEFNVLNLLVESAGSVVSKEALTEKVLGRKLGAYDRSIDVHVSRIRQKLNNEAGIGNLIKSIRGKGYQFILTEDDAE
jgi:two-component system OmpR family response regulator